MSEHTPNEWYAVRHEHGDGTCYRIDIRGNPYTGFGDTILGSEPICSIYSGFVHFEGNARLILAAPALLAACKAAFAFGLQGGTPEGGCVNRMLESAIEKASPARSQERIP